MSKRGLLPSVMPSSQPDDAHSSGITQLKRSSSLEEAQLLGLPWGPSQVFPDSAEGPSHF